MIYYKKMLRTFISIAIIYVVVIGTVFLFGYHYISQKEFERGSDTLFNDMYDFTDSRISAVREISRIICATDLSQQFMTEDRENPNRYNRLQLAKYIKIMNSLSITGNSSIMITKIYDDYAIAADSSGSLNFLLNHIGIKRDEFDAIVSSYSGSYGTAIQVTENNPSELITNYHFITRQWVNSYPLYTVVTFAKDKLFNMDALSNAEFAILKGDDIVASTGKMDDARIKALAKSSDNQYLLLKRTSEIRDYSYVMLIKRPGFISNTIWLIIAISFIMLISSILIMYLITKRMYNPIAQTIASTIGTEEGQIDEFTSIQNSFWLLQNNVEKMEQQMEHYYVNLEKQFFYDLLTGLIPKEEVADKFKEFGITQISDKYVAVLIRFTEVQASGMETSHGLIYQTRSSLLNAMRNNTSLFRVIDLNVMLEAFIFRCTDIKVLSDELRSLCLNIEPDSGLEVTAYVGTISDGLQDIAASYLHASYLASQTEYSASYNKVLVQSETDELLQNNHFNAYYPISIEQTIIGAVTSGKTAIWKNALANLIQTNKTKSPENLNHLSQMLSTTISRILSLINEEANSVYGERAYIYKAFRSCVTYEDLLGKAEEVIGKLTDYLDQKAKTSSISTKKRMTDFIHDNYSRDISLYDLADYLNMSKNYISSLFKETTGRNFKEYLSEYRINKAREIIIKKQGRIKILDVAAAVGCNTDSLLRLFMNYEGMTPSEYLKKSIDQSKIE